MTLSNGRFDEQSSDELLAALIADAKENFGEDLNDTELAIIRRFYEPVSQRLAMIQNDIGLVLDSAQIDHASDDALELLTGLIGIKREEAGEASGTVTFTRSSPAGNDFVIPDGTTVQTNAAEPVRFDTTEAKTLVGPKTNTDDSTYSTGSGSYSSQTSHTVDVSFRDSLDMQADIRTSDTNVNAKLKIVDDTNSTDLHTDSSSNTSFVTSGPSSYDVSSLSGEITIKYKLQSGDGATTVKLKNAQLDKGGQTGTTASIEAQSAGEAGNVGPNTITVMPDSPVGVKSVTNKTATDGGKDEEEDHELRDRAKRELADGSRASAPALLNSVRSLAGVTSSSININNANKNQIPNTTDDGFEIIVNGGNDDEIAQSIFDTMAGGDTSHSGNSGSAASGSADLGNGQSFTIGFTRPAEKTIYVTADIGVTDEFSEKDDVRDQIVDYIGGLFASGQETTGLDLGEDVLYGEIEYAIRSVPGVYDVTSLDVATSSPPSGSSNISITDSEIASADATDSSLTINTTTI